MSLGKTKLTIISPYPPESGGLSTYTKRLYDYLKTRREITIRVVPLNSITDIPKLFNLRSGNPDYIRLEYNIPAYGFSTIPLFVIVLFYRLFTPIKLVVNYHEVSRETQMLGFFGRIFYFTFSSIFHHIYVHTTEAKSILINRCRINSAKITVIAHGITILDGGTKKPSLIRKHYGLDSRKIILLFGFIHPDKGIEYALKALALIKRSNKNIFGNIQLVIAGDIRMRGGIFKIFQNKDKEYKLKLLSLVRELELDGSVTFLSYIEPTLVKSLLQSAYIALMPYVRVEQSGVLNLLLPIGKPIIASNIGGLGETLKDTGILVGVGEVGEIVKQIKKLLQDKMYYTEVKRSYQKLTKQLDTSNVVNQFITSLNSI